MRGTPIWQVVLVTLMFALAAWPVWRLTSPATAAVPVGASAPVANTAPTGSAVAEALTVSVAFTPAPADFALRYLGSQTVLAGQGPTADFSGPWSVKIPADGVDLALQARWPEGTAGHAAARLSVRYPDGREVAQTFWGDAGEAMVQVLTLQP